MDLETNNNSKDVTNCLEPFIYKNNSINNNININGLFKGQLYNNGGAKCVIKLVNYYRPIN